MTGGYLIVGSIAILTFLVWRLWSALDRLSNAHNNNADLLIALVEAIGEEDERR